MKLRITKTIAYDTQPLIGHELNFFSSSNANQSSVTEMNEKVVMEWLFNPRQQFRNFFIEDFFETPEAVLTYLEVQEPFTKGDNKPGDLDLLLIHPARPDRVIAFECKRVKITTLENGKCKINKAEQIRKGVKQASAYQALGFFQTYLLIILEEDGRNISNPGVLFNYNKSQDKARIYDIPWNEKLHNDVGVTFIDINQITGRRIQEMGTIGFTIDKYASPLEQPASLTRRVAQFLQERQR